MRARHPLRRLARRLGRRGAALLIFAVVDVAIGTSLTFPDARAGAATLPAYAAHKAVMPLAVWGVLWLAVAVVAAVSAFTRRDAVGFTVAIGIKAVWALAFLASWFPLLPWHAARGWIGAVTWGVVAGLVGVISGWPEPPPPPTSPDRPAGAR